MYRLVELEVNLDRNCTKLENSLFEAEFHPYEHTNSFEKVLFGNFLCPKIQDGGRKHWKMAF